MVGAANEIADRALSFGASALTEAELVAMLLHRGELGDMALAKARGLLDGIGGFQGLLTCDAGVARAQELNRLQSAALLSAVELGRRLAQTALASECLGDPAAVARYIHLTFGRPSQMVIGAIFMDIRNRVVGQVDAFRGLHGSVLGQPRPILREALRHNAHGLIVFQSRPNGDPKVSKQDVAWAAEIRKACKLVGLELNDYLVLAGEHWASVRRLGTW